MTPLPQLRQAMSAIAEEKGDFSLFGLFMRADSPGRWDLVVAAPWLEVGKLKALGELVRLLEDQLGEREVRRFAKIVTLKPSSPEIRAELATLNIDRPEQRFYNTTLFGADVEEAVVFRAKPPRGSSEVPPNKPLQPTSRARRSAKKKRTARAARGLAAARCAGMDIGRDYERRLESLFLQPRFTVRCETRFPTHEEWKYTYVFDHFDEYCDDIAERPSRIDRLNEIERWLNIEIQPQALPQNPGSERRLSATRLAISKAFEKCTAGVSIRRGSDSPPAKRSIRVADPDQRPALGKPQPRRRRESIAGGALFRA